MVTNAEVATIARTAGEMGDAGAHSWVRGGTVFDLRERGYCARFVRQCHEAALGLRPFEWAWCAANARQMERRLVANGKRVEQPEPGDIIGLNRTSNRHGHIGIYLGGGRFAENTSSGRGPGTTISRIVHVVHQITGYYRVLPSGVLKVIRLPGSDVIYCRPEKVDGVTRCDLRTLAEALGYEVHDRIDRDGKVYLRRNGGD